MASPPRVALTIFLGVLTTLSSASVDSVCGNHEMCEEADEVRSNAMLQVNSQTHKHASSTSAHKMRAWLAEVKAESALNRDDCIAHPLKEARLLQVEQQTSRLGAQTQPSQQIKKEALRHQIDSLRAEVTRKLEQELRAEALLQKLEQEEFATATQAQAPEAPGAGEIDQDPVASLEVAKRAPLNAAGFKEVTSLCCPSAMEQFFNRLLLSMGLVVCSKPHIQGLMHWFHCVPDMDFQYVLDVIENGNPCKYWAPVQDATDGCVGIGPKGIGPQCAGHWCR